MKTWASRITKFLGWLLIVYVVVIGINEAWFRFSVGTKVWNSPWTGKFSSTKYAVSGRLLADLPDPLPRNQKFEFDAVIYYNIWSMSLTGRYARAVFVGYVEEEGRASTGKETRQIQVPRSFSFKLKESGGSSFARDISYTAHIGRKTVKSFLFPRPHLGGDAYIAGGYIVGSGEDVGTIQLQKR